MVGIQWAKIVIAFLLLFSLEMTRTPLAHAGGGIGIVPARVELKEALRGSEYEQTLTVINRESGDLTLTYIAEGEVGRWTTLRSNENPEQILEQIVVPPNTDFRARIRIAIPADAVNGQHLGQIRFQASGGDAQSGMGVSIGIASDFVVDVTGTQKLSAVVQDVLVADVEADQPPVRVTALLRNDGNVKVKPIVKLLIKDSTGAQVGEVISSETVIGPGQPASVKVEWDNSGRAAGDYVAVSSVSIDDGRKIDERELKFKIVPKGTLTRAGKLDRVVLENAPRTGAVAKVVAHFLNIGTIDTKAQFVGEVYRESALVQVVESREKLAEVGQAITLELFFNVPEAGAYRVVGRVLFEGKETETKEVAFQVTAVGAAVTTDNASAVAPAQNPSQPSQSETTAPQVSVPASAEISMLVWIVLGALALAVVGLAVVVIRRPSGGSHQQPHGRAPVG